MNVVFWLVASSLILLALLIILPPLLRKRDEEIGDDLDQRNIKIAKDRLAELKVNLASGGISQIQFDEQVTELELALSDDLDLASSATSITSPTQGRWLAYLLLVVVPALSLVLYWQLGDYQAINRVDDPVASQAQAGMPSPETINKMVAGLAEKLKKDPKNLEGWLMLGRSYKMLERYPEAVKAFEQAYQLAGDKPDVMLPYAEALSFANKGDWSGKPKELILKSLTIDSGNLTGLWFAAIAHAQQNDKTAALGYLRKLEGLLPADSADKKQIHDIIVNTEGRTRAPKSDKSEVSTGAPTIKVAINLQISLAASLQTEVKPEDTVFIYAQALSGPKMPLAITRKKVSDLPLTTTLTDADSMLPNMKLSTFKQVRLLARISKSGNAMPQPGDLIGAVEQAEVAGQQAFKIVINDRL